MMIDCYFLIVELGSFVIGVGSVWVLVNLEFLYAMLRHTWGRRGCMVGSMMRFSEQVFNSISWNSSRPSLSLFSPVACITQGDVSLVVGVEHGNPNVKQPRLTS